MARTWGISLAVAALAGGALWISLRGVGTSSPAAQGPDATVPHSWPGYQYYPSHNAVLTESTIRANWLARLGDKINGGLAIVDGTVYAVSFDKSLYAIEETTGKIRWKAQTDNILMSTPVVTPDGLVIVGSGKDGFLKPNDYISQTWGRPEGDDLYAFNAASGKLVWKFHTDGQDMPSPALAGDSIVFANGDAHAYALDARTGRLRWKIDLPGAVTMASMTIHDGKGFVSSCHNAPYVCETRAFDVSTGKTMWTNPLGGSDCTPALDAGLVFINAMTAENTQYSPGGRDTVAAIDERTGKTKWTRRFPAAPFTFVASAERQIAGTASGGVLYQSIGNLQRVVALDERTGKLRWTVHTTANVKMSPVLKGARVYFGDTAGVFYSVDRRTGRILHTISFLQPFSVSSPVIDGNTLLVANGSLVVAMPLDGV
jgi:outer membrane protein assembly factor BamB